METTFFTQYSKELIITLIIIVLFVVIRLITNSLIVRFGQRSSISPVRTQLILKYINLLLLVILVTLLITLWGVDRKDALLALSSVFTVIGVAMFAQWSILSNITAGVIIFFSSPFKIGNRIRVLDKENPLEAEIIDIRSFYTLLRNDEGEEISFPNNLLLQKGVLVVSKKSLEISIENVS